MSPSYIPVRVNISHQRQELFNELKKKCLNVWECFKTDRFLEFIERDVQAADKSEMQWINLDHLDSKENLPIVHYLNLANRQIYQAMTEDADAFTPSDKIYGMTKESRLFISTQMEESGP